MHLLAAAAAPTFEVSSWFFDWAGLIPAIMAGSFLLTLFFGKRLGKHVHLIGVTAVTASFLLAILTAAAWINATNSHDEDDHGEAAVVVTEFAGGDDLAGVDEVAFAEEGEEVEARPQAVVNSWCWFDSSDAQNTDCDDRASEKPISIGTLVDGQSVLLLVVVTFISMLVHIFSTDYVGGDRRYVHYFAFLSLFTASMLFFVLSSSTLQMIVGWELVGVCSFALIGHWWEEKPNSDAALKAFLTNRVGDIGLLIGVTVLFFAAGNSFDIRTINHAAVVGDIGNGTLAVAALCLLAAVMSKSGQFVLHTWLPDAMAGPTPVSALIHAATMVVAGVYMIGRLYPVFWEGLAIPGSSVNAMAIIGGVTVVGGGLLAFVQNDIKKVLAYSTVSQLGYMVMALGVGAWTAGMFHLFTHAIFKACLFLGAGAISHACHHSFDMKAEMGGLRKLMPKTYVTFMIATGALIGLFPLAGFWSKDEILVGAGAWPGTDGNGDYTILLIMGLIGAALTAAYMTRVIMLVFFGEYRGHDHPHDPGPRMLVPLQVLAGLAVVVGFLNVPKELPLIGDRIGLTLEHWIEPGGGDVFPVIDHGKPSFSLAIMATLIGVFAIFITYSYYSKLFAKNPRATEVTGGLRDNNRYARGFHTLLVEKYYLDHFYEGVVADGTKGWMARGAYWVNQNVIDNVINYTGKGAVIGGRFVYRFIDQGAIDGTVNGSGLTALSFGGVLRRIQSGKIRQYATLMFGAAAILAAVFIIAV
jgi:NADH-quinone oxidoreductase subunit L